MERERIAFVGLNILFRLHTNRITATTVHQTQWQINNNTHFVWILWCYLQTINLMYLNSIQVQVKQMYPMKDQLLNSLVLSKLWATNRCLTSAIPNSFHFVSEYTNIVFGIGFWANGCRLTTLWICESDVCVVFVYGFC